MSDTISLQQTIENCIEQSLSSGKIEEMINKQLTSALERAIDSSLSYGKTHDAIRSKLDSLLMPAIEQITIDNANVKLDAALARVIDESAVESRREILRKFQMLIQDVPDYCVKLSDLFATYAQYVADDFDCVGRDIDWDDSPTYESIHIKCEVAQDDDRAWSSFDYAKLYFTIEDEADDSIAEKYNIIVPLWRSHGGYVPQDEPNGCWTMQMLAINDFSAIRYLDPFTIELMRYQNAHIRIHDDIIGFDEDWVTPSREPEPTYE